MFSADVRSELARNECQWPCCANAALTAALLFSGGVAFQGPNKYRLSIMTEHNIVARYFFSLVKKHFGIAGEIETARTAQFGGRLRYRLRFPDESADRILIELKLKSRTALFGIRSTPVRATLHAPCCQVAFLRAAFMLTGFVSRPEDGYQWEVTAGNEALAQFTADRLHGFGWPAKVVARKSRFVTYVQGAEAVCEILAKLGANQAVFKMENARILKQIRNDVNRRTNCDTNNIERAVSSAQAQIERIRKIDEAIGLDNLPATLSEIARARLRDPEASLAQLGALCDPPIGKSGVTSRLRRLNAIADDLDPDT